MAFVLAVVAVVAGASAALVGVVVARASGATALPAVSSAATGFLLALLGGLWVAMRVRLQSRSLLSTINRFATGEMAARAESADLAELAELAGSFNQMADRVSVATRRLAHDAFHDPLTGLPNRMYFMSRLRAAMHGRSGPASQLAVFCLDVDRFKNINDTLGHAVGDELLSVVAVRLLSTVGKDHMVARMGGDEFMVLVQDMGEAETQALAARITEALRRSFHVGDHELFVTVSVGVAMTGRNGASGVADLLRQADVAMYSAKGAGPGRFAMFEPALERRSPDMLRLEAGLTRAIDRGELCVFYQPQVDLERGEITGIEALIRWEHPERGMVSPAEFIPLAEETGEIMRIGAWVLERACIDGAALWRRYPALPLHLGVNVSARELHDAGLVDRITRVLAATGLPPSALELEITESAIISDVDGAIETLQRLRRLGIGLAIDDFGTGYSSLAYLQRLPLTTLKIDRSFVRDIGTSARSAALARALVEMATTLGMDVVAEGIETREQVDFLRMLRCGRGQGFLFAQPQPFDSLVRLMEARMARREAAA